MSKRIVTLFLAFVMLLSVLPFSVWATDPDGLPTPEVGEHSAPEVDLPDMPEYGIMPDDPDDPEGDSPAPLYTGNSCGENATWKIEGGVLYISGTGDMYNFRLGEAPWYYYGQDISMISIQSGITSIGSYAFADFDAMTAASVPGTVKVLGEGAFYHCERLQTISLSSGLTSIGNYAFAFDGDLKRVTVPDAVKSIGYGAFYSCTSLSEVNLGDSLTSIGKYAFMTTPELTGIVIPDSVTFIDNGAFCESGLKSVTISENLTAINECVFDFCESLTSVVIPASVKSLGNWAFSNCTSLTQITFLGNAPKFAEHNVFYQVVAAVFYPVNDSTWTNEVKQHHGGILSWIAKAIPGVTVPLKPYKIVNVVSGVHVYWESLVGVNKFGLWRSETGKDGTYKWIANPAANHFTDTSVVSGKTYYYKITTMDVPYAIHSEKSEPIGITYVATPDITSRTNTAKGVQLGWEAIEGAAGYAIYRKSYDGDDAWARVATIGASDVFSWTDTSVKNNNGEVYKYTIRALVGPNLNTLSGCRNAGRTMVRMSSQVLSSATRASATSIKCEWTTSSRVTGYEVRFMVDGNVYKTFTVGNYKTGVKTFTGLKSGETYTVQVRTYKKVEGVGSFYSDWSSAKTVKI